jgi:hypothetical protein
MVLPPSVFATCQLLQFLRREGRKGREQRLGNLSSRRIAASHCRIGNQRTYPAIVLVFFCVLCGSIFVF